MTEFGESIAAIGRRMRERNKDKIEEQLSEEAWANDEKTFEKHFGISYEDFSSLVMALPQKMEKYDKIRNADLEAAILWLIHEGKTADLLRSKPNELRQLSNR